MFYLITVCRTD